MAVTSGFYNSLEGDRKYDAIQVSRIFDGIIEDGVYETIGEAFRIRATTGNSITVATGRAWFDHSWTLNDAILPINLESSEILQNRWDAIVLETNSNDAYRNNSIYAVTGTPGSTPAKPEMKKSKDINQYPLAYIYRKAGSEEITQEDITNAIGTSECPFVIGVLKVMNIDMFIDQWSAQWNAWLADKTVSWQVWLSEIQGEFNEWFANLQVLLEDDVAANLAGAILRIEGRLELFDEEGIMTYTIDDSNGDPISDTNNINLNGAIKYQRV